MVDLANIAGFQMMGALSQGKDPFQAMQEANVLKAQEQSFLAKATEEQRAAQNEELLRRAAIFTQDMNPAQTFEVLSPILGIEVAGKIATEKQKVSELGMPKVPEGYMFEGGRAVPIPGIEPDSKLFEKEKDLRARYEKRVVPLDDKIRAFSSALELQAQNSGAADIGLIKMAVQAHDKRASIVTDSEFGQVAETGGLVDRFGASFKGYVAGQKLTENQRNQVVKVIEQEARLAEKDLERINKDFDANAQRYGVDFKPVREDFSTTPIDEIKKKYNQPIKINSEDDWKKMQPGTLYIAPDNSIRRKK